MEEKQKISIIIPAFNEEENIAPLVARITNSLLLQRLAYEIIFVDDHSTDKTQEKIKSLLNFYPISLHLKKGEKGKAQSLIEGFSYAKYETLCMIDADLQYPPEAIPEMVKKLREGAADVVVANRKESKANLRRRFISTAYLLFFVKMMHKLDCDVQSGLKVFRKEIIERIATNPSPWAFDLEFLVKARNAGYKIASHDIVFSERRSGKSKIGLIKASLEIGWSAIKHKFIRSDIVPFHPNQEKEKGKGFHYKGREFIHHSKLHHSQTSFHRLSGIQIFVLLYLFFNFVIGLYLNWHFTLVLIVALLTILYFADLLFNLYLIYRSFSKSAEIKISAKEMKSMNENDWPDYTVFCPLYNEWRVLPQFVTAMSRLEYPKDKLQVMLLLEEDDKETIAYVQKYQLPKYFDVTIVPHSLPKTKPKALNYGLTKATGKYAVIYDAEDIPDSQQLKKAVFAFQKADPKTICVQAKLNFYNPHQNLLTKVFTSEYTLWFDLVLTGLQSIHAPIPLGGTSNHFRTVDLYLLKGWDSFNVTEDCDLGMRLVKQGYRTAVMDSTTLEEANSNLKNWFGQRARWIKGYMQTYLLHMRNPHEFIQNWTEPHVVTFQLVVGGKVMSMFINPLMWAITISYFVFRTYVGTFIESFFPTPILYMGVTSLLFGNFLYMYYYMIGCAKHGHYELTKYGILVPFYWLAMSIAAWVALYRFIVQPHHWFKTKHGLYLQNNKAKIFASNTIGKALVDEELIRGRNEVKPTVTIFIPAYNEGRNIATILKQVISQKEKGFIVEKIIVASDGSVDNTAEIAKRYKKWGVDVIEGKTNRGHCYRYNQVISKISSDILVLLNADILLRDNESVSSLVAPILSGADLTAQWAEPVRPRTYIEKIQYLGFQLKYFVYINFKGGNNIFTCVGHLRALSRKFYSNIKFPASTEGEDQYLYFMCINRGYRYEFSHYLKAYYKLPDNFNDYKKFAKRVFQTQIKFGDIFGEKFTCSERKIPLRIQIWGCLYALQKNPFYTSLYIILHLLIQQWSLKQPLNAKNVFEISNSTKYLALD